MTKLENTIAWLKDFRDYFRERTRPEYNIEFYGCNVVDKFDEVLELLKEREWISCKDKLPEKSGYYLIISDNGHADVLSYSVRHKAFNAFDLFEDARYALRCTHWMPIPKLPKGDEQDD